MSSLQLLVAVWFFNSLKVWGNYGSYLIFFQYTDFTAGSAEPTRNQVVLLFNWGWPDSFKQLYMHGRGTNRKNPSTSQCTVNSRLWMYTCSYPILQLIDLRNRALVHYTWQLEIQRTRGLQSLPLWQDKHIQFNANLKMKCFHQKLHMFTSHWLQQGLCICQQYAGLWLTSASFEKLPLTASRPILVSIMGLQQQVIDQCTKRSLKTMQEQKAILIAWKVLGEGIRYPPGKYLAPLLLPYSWTPMGNLNEKHFSCTQECFSLLSSVSMEAIFYHVRDHWFILQWKR